MTGVLMCLGMSVQAVPIPDDVVHHSVVFGTGGGEELSLELYTPRAEFDGPRPAMVFLHGGAWKGGNPSQFARHSIRLAQKGYVAVSSRYRFSPAAHFPAAVEDARCAVRWLRAHYEELSVDANRIGVGGGSAGGHLAAMVAYTTGFEGEGGNEGLSSAVCCFVGFNPVLDLVDLWERKPGHPMLINFIGKPYDEAKEAYEAASPLRQITADAPPTLLLHGDQDTTVPYAQAESLIAKLTELGIPAELYTAEGVGHAFFNKDPWYERTVERMEQFLDEHLMGTD